MQLLPTSQELLNPMLSTRAQEAFPTQRPRFNQVKTLLIPPLSTSIPLKPFLTNLNQAYETVYYHKNPSKKTTPKILHFVSAIGFSLLNLRSSAAFLPISNYALIIKWLLPSQFLSSSQPQKNLCPLNQYLKTLPIVLGCFPIDNWPCHQSSNLS